MNPYRIEGPALISFSGGRTSAFMLHEVLQAHGGQLPADVIVAFANTGKEREETLRFVHECATRWNVPIRWVEWAPRKPWFHEVGYNSAKRRGEPFSDLVDTKQRLPNGRERWCTEHLKVRPIFRLMEHVVGLQPGGYTEAIGLRHDEGFRILKGLEKAERGGRRIIYPLSRAKVLKPDVLRFWLGENTDPRALTHPLPQGFDLGLRDHEGNCDLCFLKGRQIRRHLIRERLADPSWWQALEEKWGARFDSHAAVADLVDQVRSAPMLFDEADDEEFDAECGLHCAVED